MPGAPLRRELRGGAEAGPGGHGTRARAAGPSRDISRASEAGLVLLPWQPAALGAHCCPGGRVLKSGGWSEGGPASGLQGVGSGHSPLQLPEAPRGAGAEAGSTAALQGLRHIPNPPVPAFRFPRRRRLPCEGPLKALPSAIPGPFPAPGPLRHLTKPRGAGATDPQAHAPAPCQVSG